MKDFIVIKIEYNQYRGFTIDILGNKSRSLFYFNKSRYSGFLFQLFFIEFNFK